MVGAEGKIFLKIEDSRSLKTAISEFYQRLFERSISRIDRSVRAFFNAVRSSKLDLST